MLARSPEADELGGDRVEGIEPWHHPDEAAECVPDGQILGEGRRTLRVDAAPVPDQRGECRPGPGKEVHDEDDGGDAGQLVAEKPDDPAPLPVGDRGDIEAELDREVEDRGIRLREVGKRQVRAALAGPVDRTQPHRRGEGLQSELLGAGDGDELDQVEPAPAGRLAPRGRLHLVEGAGGHRCRTEDFLGGLAHSALHLTGAGTPPAGRTPPPAVSATRPPGPSAVPGK